MARRKRAAAAAEVPDPPGGVALEPQGPTPDPGTGPHDGDSLDPDFVRTTGTVDFGAVRVPVPTRGTVIVGSPEPGQLQAVQIEVPEGRLSVSALAAPRSSTLWPELAREIHESLRDGGARVRSFPGTWGRELHATTGEATSVFVGVDGPRWMLYGVATGPTSDAGALDAELRRMLRGTIVVRGRSPYPVRTVLPLVRPEHLAEPAPVASVEPEVEAAPEREEPGQDPPPAVPAAPRRHRRRAAEPPPPDPAAAPPSSPASSAPAQSSTLSPAEVRRRRRAPDPTAPTEVLERTPTAPRRHRRRAVDPPASAEAPVPPPTEARRRRRAADLPAAAAPPAPAAAAPGGRRRAAEPAAGSGTARSGRRRAPDPTSERSAPPGAASAGPVPPIAPGAARPRRGRHAAPDPAEAEAEAVTERLPVPAPPAPPPGRHRRAGE